MGGYPKGSKDLVGYFRRLHRASPEASQDLQLGALRVLFFYSFPALFSCPFCTPSIVFFRCFPLVSSGVGEFCSFFLLVVHSFCCSFSAVWWGGVGDPGCSQNSSC